VYTSLVLPFLRVPVKALGSAPPYVSPILLSFSFLSTTDLLFSFRA